MKNDIMCFSQLTSEIDAIYHIAALKFGLSDSSLRILYSICLRGDGCLLNDVVRLTAISKQTINSALRKLEGDGILYLKSAEGNKKRVYLTEKGKELSANSAMRILNIESDILSSWTQDEKETYIKLTEKFFAAFSEKIKKEL